MMALIMVFALLIIGQAPVFAQEGISDYLCEIGEGYYLKGQYDDALHEFNKALMVNPDSPKAKSYIQKINLRLKSPISREAEPVKRETPKPVAKLSLPVPAKEPAEEEQYVVPAKKEIIPQRKVVPLDKAREPSIEPVQSIKKTPPPVALPEPRKYLPSTVKEPVLPALSKGQVIDLALAKFEKELNQPVELQPIQSAPDKAADRFSGKKNAGEDSAAQGLKVSGSYQLAVGGTSDGFEWKKANGNLNERDYRVLSDAALNNRENTFDYRIFDRFRMAVDTLNPEGLNIHANITVDPWSFTGKSGKFTVTSANGTDTAEVELKYWSNTGRTYNDVVYTANNGDSFALPEIKVDGFKTSAVSVGTVFGGTFNIPSKNIDREFQPMRELWFDYKRDTFKFRFFPLALGNQALTSDDPLMLSNHAVYWEESPWLLKWEPGHLNSAAGDFSRGRWSDSLAFNTRDSDLIRLTALRGFSFDYFPSDETSFKLTGASPKGLWQDYDSFDNIPAAARFKQKIGDSLQIGNTYTFRMGLNEDKGNKMDALNHAGGLDLAFSPVSGAKIESEIAISQSKQDLTSSEYKSRERGMAYHLALIGSPDRDILESSYNQINPKESDTSFLKARFQFTHMDKGFEPVLSSYRESRDDQFWSRHLHFRKPFARFYGDADINGEPSLSWYDIAPYAIGDGIDTGRDVIGFRLEMSSFDRRLDELFDVRNVHRTGGKYLENVARSETTYKATDKLTTKLLTIYHDVHSTYGNKDPYLVDSQTDRYYDNTNMPDGKSPSMKTVSMGANYDFFDWLSTYGVWEYSNDINAAYDAFGRGLLNSSSFETFSEYGKTYRRQTAFVYNQQYFPLPPYPFNNAYKLGITLRPAEKLEIFLDYTRNEYEYAGQISDDMNHAGIEIGFYPSKKWGIFTKYAFSQVNDLVRMNNGEGVFYESHHNFFFESRFSFSDDDQLTFQFGEFGRSPIALISTDPFQGSLGVLDTQYIYRLYYRRKF